MVTSSLAAIDPARYARSGPHACAAQGRSRLRQLRFAAAVLLLGTAVPVRALTIPFIDAYSETLSATGANAGAAASVVLDTGGLFPSALGTLEDIDLQFSGSVNFIVAPGLNVLPDPPLSPVPYAIQPQLSIEIDGLTDLYDLQPIALGTTVPSSGAGGSSSTVGSYSFRFSYHEVLGQFLGPQNVSVPGPIALSPPFTLAGGLEDFDSGQALTNNLLISYMLTFTEIGRVSSAPTVVTAVSSLVVMTTYTYSAPPVPVPAPGGAWLLVAGLAALLVARRAHGQAASPPRRGGCLERRLRAALRHFRL
jgi:hypothetical protein